MLLGGLVLVLPAAMAIATEDAAQDLNVRIMVYLVWACPIIGLALHICSIIMLSFKKPEALRINAFVGGVWVVLLIVFAARAGVHW